MKKTLAAFVDKLIKITTDSFVAKAFDCVNVSYGIHSKKLPEIIGMQGESEASVVLNNWSPSDAKKATALGCPKNFRMFRRYSVGNLQFLFHTQRKKFPNQRSNSWFPFQVHTV